MNGLPLAHFFNDTENDGNGRPRNSSSEELPLTPLSVTSESRLLPGNQSTTAFPRARNQSTTGRPLDTKEDFARMKKFIKTYKNLKVCFIILLIFNAALVIMYVLTNGTFSVRDEQEQNTMYEKIVGYIDNRLPKNKKETFRLCSKYEYIFERSKLDVPEMPSCKSKYNPEYCCFDSTDQLFSLFHEYTNRYVKYALRSKPYLNCIQNFTKDKLQHLSLLKPWFHAEYDSSAHPNGLENSELTWTAVNSSRFVEFRSNKTVIIPISGFYYVYSNVHYSTQRNGRHYSFHYNSSTLFDANFNCRQFWEGIFHFEARSKVHVETDTRDIDSDDISNYFGMYML
ncbi:uncharacterized protein LOC121375615 [Gigantopelta aegis]|uniref:uncharacterized protein LOC121375615 n=1 Tax=Gigantopelta aegis TaxID=1735272 RepID=UPI001B889318|nr:uncharacterized protein LOC121375615 [Gigantopelta aegis]